MQHGRVNICVLGQADPCAWMPHLVKAFSSRAQVITIGPRVDGWPYPDHIEADLGALGSLYDALPPNWTPDLVFAVSGGGASMLTSTHDLPCPTVFYSVDTWQCYMDYVEALHYDIVFAGQRAYIPLLRATGSRHVFWLPLACDPECHRPMPDQTKRCDIVFVGGISRPVHHRRASLLDALRKHFTVEPVDGAYGEDMCRAFARGRLAFNHSSVEDVNMRIFEALAMGCALLTNRDSEVNGLLEWFEDGRHLITYDSERDLLEKCQEYLRNGARLKTIGETGRAEVLARHTYLHRVDTVLETVQRLAGNWRNRRVNAVRRRDNLAFHLPLIPGRVLDIGMQVEASKYSLARDAVTWFAGLTADTHLRRQRAGSFHEVSSVVSRNWHAAFDTAVVSNPAGAGLSGKDALRTAWTCLAEGGTVLIEIGPGGVANPDGQSLESWFRELDFHLTHTETRTNGRTLVTARKRTRRLRSIAKEVCERLQVPGVTADVVTAMLPEDL